jgi:flagellar motor component MotA
LIIDSPLNDPNGKFAFAIKIIDYILTSIFCLEGITKIVAFGFIFNGPDSYLRETWNVIDFIIILISVISASLTSVNLSVLKVIRLFRVLRPLKLISKNEGLKVSH